MDLPESVAAILATARLAARSRLCVALSGGVDSVVLLHILAGMRATLGFELQAAHVHHGLSANADGWLAFCERACGTLAVPLRTFRVQVPRDDPAGVEAAARRVRHEALSGLECDWLVFGHHRDDQAETLLFRLLRGTGVRGAGAMAAIEAGRPGRLRPLLEVPRAEVLTYARRQGLEWIEDESNADTRYARNYLRHAVLPVIEQAFPGAAGALARAAGNFREAGVLLDELAAHDESSCGGVPMAREALLRLSDERICNLLRWQLRRLGREAPARARLVEGVRQLREAGAAQPLRLALGSVACCAYRGQVWLEAREEGGEPRGARWRGDRELSWGCGRVRFDVAVSVGIDRAMLERAGEVVLERRWPGLAMREGAGRPRRSFKNLCQEAGIPAWMRDRLPVLRVDGEAAWIGEIGVSGDFACADGREGLLPVWLR